MKPMKSNRQKDKAFQSPSGAKEKAIKFLRSTGFLPLNMENYNKLIDVEKALDIAIKEAKKEVFDDIEKKMKDTFPQIDSFVIKAKDFRELKKNATLKNETRNSRRTY